MLWAHTSAVGSSSIKLSTPPAGETIVIDVRVADDVAYGSGDATGLEIRPLHVSSGSRCSQADFMDSLLRHLGMLLNCAPITFLSDCVGVSCFIWRPALSCKHSVDHEKRE